MFCCQSDILNLLICRDESANKGFRGASSAKPAPESPETKQSPFHAAVAAVRSHKVHAALHIYRSNLRNARSKQPSPSRYYFSMPWYQEAVKTMIDPESWRHTADVYSSRFKIIVCFPPPIFCLSTTIISAILAAPIQRMAAIVFSFSAALILDSKLCY